jgi:Protein of unknown function (DUF4019)
MKRATLLAVICVLSTPWVFAQEKSTEAGQKSAETWLAIVDTGDYAKSWDEAAAIFKAAVAKEQWQKALTSSRGQFGKVLSRKLKSATFTTTLPGAPDGQYVVIQYESSFENKKSAVETITPMLDKDGTWRVSGYFIR